MIHDSPRGLDFTVPKETMSDQALPMVLSSSVFGKEVPRKKD